jgi:cytochrome c-type biogenesis protein CcmH/NrfF
MSEQVSDRLGDRGEVRRILAAAVTAVLLGAGPAAAGPDDVAVEVYREVMSPFCPGVTLHDCPSSKADELRLQIARWAETGMSKNEIMARLEAEFGPDIRAVPQPEGAGLFAWLLPALGALAGLLLAWILARRYASRHAPRDGAAAAAGPSAEERRRLEGELAAIRSER